MSPEACLKADIDQLTKTIESVLMGAQRVNLDVTFDELKLKSTGQSLKPNGKGMEKLSRAEYLKELGAYADTGLQNTPVIPFTTLYYTSDGYLIAVYLGVRIIDSRAPRTRPPDRDANNQSHGRTEADLATAKANGLQVYHDGIQVRAFCDLGILHVQTRQNRRGYSFSTNSHFSSWPASHSLNNRTKTAAITLNQTSWNTTSAAMSIARTRRKLSVKASIIVCIAGCSKGTRTQQVHPEISRFIFNDNILQPMTISKDTMRSASFMTGYRTHLSNTKIVNTMVDKLLQGFFSDKHVEYTQAFQAGKTFDEDVGPFIGRAFLYKVETDVIHFDVHDDLTVDIVGGHFDGGAFEVPQLNARLR